MRFMVLLASFLGEIREEYQDSKGRRSFYK